MNPHYQHAQQVTQQVPQQVWPQNPQQARPAIPKPNPSAYIVRGRPHDSIVQASPVGKGIEDYISYH